MRAEVRSARVAEVERGGEIVWAPQLKSIVEGGRRGYQARDFARCMAVCCASYASLR